MTVRADVFIDQRVDAVAEDALLDQIKALLKALRPDWLPDALQFQPYTNGITNKVIRVTGGANEVLVFRIFGVGTERVVDRTKELYHFELLSRHGLAPKVEGRFANGFVCGFFPGKTLDVQSVRSAKIVPKIAARLAQLHQVPAGEGPHAAFFDLKFRQFAAHVPTQWRSAEMGRTFQHLFGEVRLQADFERVQALIAGAKQRDLVLCHNDLLVHNLLYDEASDQVHFIDYEYTDVNYRLFDIANHFNEYAGVENANYDLCPNEEEKYTFIQHYLEALEGAPACGARVQALLAEVPIFEAASHLLWSVWALVQAQHSEIDFDYMQYAAQRHEQHVRILSNAGLI